MSWARDLSVVEVCVLASVVSSLLNPPSLAQGDVSVQLRDDRGQALESSVEVCRVDGLERDCVVLEPPAVEVLVPRDVDFLTAEGPEHGPVSVSWGDLVRDEAGHHILKIPRKAHLQVVGADTPLTLSFYRKRDPLFRRPFRRLKLDVDEPTDGIRAPAGDFLISLSASGFAPDLQLAELLPGSVHALEYVARPGWSALFRALDALTEEPISQTEVHLAAAPGYERTAKARHGFTDSAGLVVFNGLTMPLAAAAFRHRDFVDEVRHGVATTPGTFAFETAELSPPGGLEAHVLVEQEPLAGIPCKLLQMFRPTRLGEEDPRPPVFEGSTEEDGVCRARKVPAGRYVLELSPLGRGKANVVEEVMVERGRTARLDLELEPLLVSGRVLRGDEPAESYRVEIRELDRSRRSAPNRPTARPETDDEGRYETTLWEAGFYTFALFTPSGAVSEVRTAQVDDQGAIVDFELAENEIQGSVVDSEGRPVEEAYVVLKSERRGKQEFRNVQVGEDGAFQFALGQGHEVVELSAEKEGYEASKVRRVDLRVEEAPPSILLVLERRDAVRGLLVNGRGEPVPGAWVGSLDPRTPARPLLATRRTSSMGRFELPVARGSVSTLVLATGPGCPLTLRSVESQAGSTSGTESFSCAPSPAGIRMTLLDERGTPVSNAGVYVRRGPLLLPVEALHAHQQQFGAPVRTDGAGRLSLVGLQPGHYELYLADATSPERILGGRPEGHLSSVSLHPLEIAELEVTVDRP